MPEFVAFCDVLLLLLLDMATVVTGLRFDWWESCGCKALGGGGGGGERMVGSHRYEWD
jgi:hypothetical protein